MEETEKTCEKSDEYDNIPPHTHTGTHTDTHTGTHTGTHTHTHTGAAHTHTHTQKGDTEVKQGQKLITMCAAGVVFLLLAGCYAPRADRLQTNLSYAELQEQMAREQQEFLDARSRSIEALERSGDTLVLPVQPLAPTFNPLDEVLVSITVQNETLHNILYVVARNAGLNLVIDPKINLDNRITVSFEHSPSSVVIDKLLDAFDLSWEVENNILSVQQYKERTFNLGFLNTQTDYSLDSGGDIFGSAGDSSTDLSGNFEVSSNISASDSIYELLKQNVEDILEEKSSGSSGGGGSTGASGGQDEDTKGFFTLDMTSGSLYVRSTPKIINAVARLVAELRKKLSRQVIIDAQIMEVTLNDGFRLGIDWNFVQHRIHGGELFQYGLGMFPGSSGFGTFGNAVADPSANLSPSPIVLNPRPGQNLDPGTVVGGDGRFAATLDALQTFGGVKSLSNPHIRTRHGNPALVTSGRSERYLQEIRRVRDTETNEVSYTTVTATAFQGVMLGVVPFIDDDGSVDLSIFPISSDVDLSTTVELGDGSRLTMPKVDVRNVNTNVRVRHGDMIILGGMIYKTSSKVDRQAPGVGAIPGLGWLFKNRVDAEQSRELVVVMRIRVVE